MRGTLALLLAGAVGAAGCATTPPVDPFASLQPDLARRVADGRPYCMETFYRVAHDGMAHVSEGDLRPSSRQIQYSNYDVNPEREIKAMEAAGLIVPAAPRDDYPHTLWWRLTDEARKYPGRYEGEICWGHWSLVSVEITRKTRRIACFDLNDVDAVYRFDGVPPWAQTEGFKAAFPRARTVDGELVKDHLVMARMSYPDKTVRWSPIEFGPHSNVLC